MCLFLSLHCFPSPACRLNVAFGIIAAAAAVVVVVVVVAAAVIAAAAVVVVVLAAVVVAAAAVVVAVVVAAAAATVIAAVAAAAAAVVAAVVVVAAAVVVAVAAAVVVAAAAAASVAIVKALVYAGSPLFLLNVSLSCRARSGGHSPQEDTKWYKKESPTNQSRPLPCVTKFLTSSWRDSSGIVYRTCPVLYFVAVPRVVILLGA